MKQLTCEMCGSTDLVKSEGVFICQSCGCKYTVEEAKRMLIEGTVDVQGTVKVDNSAFVQKYLANARRALDKEDWEEVEKYYNMVEQNAPHSMEAVFFSSYGKAMLSLTGEDYFRRQQIFNVMNKSISVINDYYEETDENKEEVLRKIAEYIKKMYSITFVFNRNATGNVAGSRAWCIGLLNSTKATFITELKQILEIHNESYIQVLITELSAINVSGGCYVATAVYGSYDCPQVWTLRRYRDYTLAETWYGRVFIRTYYAVSPTLVKWFGHTDWFKNMWKPKLDRLVEKLNQNGVDSTPYQDRNW